MKRVVLAVLSVVVVASTGLNLSAQTPSVELRLRIQATDGLPLGGALVALIDANNRVVAEGISPESGARSLTAPPGVYRVRIRRIGFRPFISDPVVIPHLGQLVVTVETPRVVLNTVLVTAKSSCQNIGEDASQLGTVWEEVDKNLRSSQLSLNDISGIGWSRIYRNQVGLESVVLSGDTTTVRLKNQKPFGAPDPEFLARAGYVHGEEIKGWEYFAPDEAVLLSDSFRSTHCFSLARDKARPGEIGVAFKPLAGHHVSDISGTFWVNDTSAALTEVTFRYVNAGLLSRFRAGGFARFRRTSSGAVIVDSWELSAPNLEMRAAQNQQIAVTGYTADGGMIISGAQYDSLMSRPMNGATIFGIIDDEKGSPIEGAQVRVRAGHPNAVSDSLGRFQLTGLHAGTFVVHFRRPGFSGEDFPVTLSQNQRLEVRSKLGRTGTQSSTIAATAAEADRKYDEFFSLRSHGLGTFVARTEIERRNASNATQLLQNIPGLLVRQKGKEWVIRSQRCGGDVFMNIPSGPPVVFVDGFVAEEGAAILDTINPEDIEAIEVYQGASKLPAEARGKGCTAIFVWLRLAQ